MNNNYIIFYKTDNKTNWQSKRLDLPIEEWEEYCKKQGYFEYDIKDLRTYGCDFLHLLTNIVLFDGKYYQDSEKIPYPKSESNDIGKFDLFLNWKEDEIDDKDYEEIYQGESLWTNVITNFSIKKDMEVLGIVAEWFIKDFPEFLEKLKRNGHAVYINDEYSPFKWLAWLKENKIRIIHQDYRYHDITTEFDILVDKDWFFVFCKDWINKMREYADKDLKKYNDYVKRTYGDKE